MNRYQITGIIYVDGCIWIGRGEGGGEHERSRQEKGAQVVWVIRQIQIGVVV